jgi:replicative DNA helicase
MPDHRDIDGLLQPPASIEAEQSVIGGLLLNNAALDLIDDKLTAADFYTAANRTLFSIVRDLIVRGKAADATTVIGALEHADELHSIGGRPYVLDILRNVPTSANIAHYAAMVRDRSVRRQLIALGAEYQALGYARDGRTVEELLDHVTRSASTLAESGLREEPVTLRSLMSGVVDAIEVRGMSDEPDKLPGMSTGLVHLDQRMLGMQPGDLFLIAGETGSGKTTLAMGIGIHTALVAKQVVAVFSMEMKGRALAERALANAGTVHKRALRTGKLEPDDWAKVSHGIAKIQDGADLIIDPSPLLTVERMRAQCKRIQRKHGLALVIVDYIQLMQGPGDTENDRITHISRGLKLLAGELGVPVIALSQLSRKFMSRPDKRPQRSDLRGSGSLEQDADVILFVYREALHSPEDESVKDAAELILSKLREESPGTVYAKFYGQFSKFVDAEQRPVHSTPKPRSSGKDLD